MDTPTQQIAQENKGTLIRCRAEGDPVPKISWYFNGASVNGTITSVPVSLGHCSTETHSSAFFHFSLQ